MTTNSGDTGQSRIMKASEFGSAGLGLIGEAAVNGGEITVGGKVCRRTNELIDFHSDPADGSPSLLP